MQPYVSFISLPLCLIFPITEILFAQPWTTVAPCPLVLAPGCPRSPCALLAPAEHFPQPEVSEGCPASRHLQALPVARGMPGSLLPSKENRTEQHSPRPSSIFLPCIGIYFAPVAPAAVICSFLSICAAQAT